MVTQDDKPLRADAERNRQRILDAARELFAQRGLGVTLNDIAHHAGVGVGTVYRRYPDKAKLIDELFEQGLQELVDMAQAALQNSDPWEGLVGFLTQGLELQAGDRGFKEVALGAPDMSTRAARLRARILPLAARMVARARHAGQLRADISPEDFPIVQLMLGAVIDTARDVEPELWRRYLEIVLQGFRADPQSPDPLRTAPLKPGQVEHVLAAWQPPRR